MVVIMILQLRGAFSPHRDGTLQLAMMQAASNGPACQTPSPIRSTYNDTTLSNPATNKNEGLPQSKTVSSCLMVMDDNHRLPEWIAYHYTVLHLRHLVVLSDPDSRDAPSSVLQPWRDLLEIEEWTDADYVDTDLAGRMDHFRNHSDTARHKLLVERQSKFLKQCALHLQARNRTWVTFHDVDEFYVLNSRSVRNATKVMEEPGSIVNLLNEAQQHLQPLQQRFNHWNYFPQQFAGPCVTTHREQYGAVESTVVERQRGVPSFLDPANFETLQWRHHQGYKLGKSLLDVSRVPDLATMGWPGRDRNPFSPHRLIPVCPKLRYNANAWIVINHYLGSWKNYSSRHKDGRKRRDTWEMESNRQGGQQGDDIRPWIAAFELLVGSFEAQRLLAGAGQLLRTPANKTVAL